MLDGAIGWLQVGVGGIAVAAYLFGGIGIVADHFDSDTKKLTRFRKMFFCLHYFGMMGAIWANDKVRKFAIAEIPPPKPVRRRDS